MKRDLLTSLAIIKVNWSRGQDYIGNFVPFVAECLRRAPQPEISLQQIQSGIAEEFGLEIPQGALKTILTRVKRQGYVTQVHGTYRRNDDALLGITLAKDRARILRQYEELIDKLTHFSRTSFGLEWTEDNAETAFLSFLEDYSASILAASVEGSPIPSPNRTDGRDRFVVHSFVLHLLERDSAGFDFLEAIVKGRMLANALVYPNLGQIRQRLERVDFYFDTSFLLRAIGLSGPSLQAPCLELLAYISHFKN